MKKDRMIKIGVITAAVIGFLYIAIGYYFSSVLIDFSPRPLEEDRTNLKIESPADFGLGKYEEFQIDRGDVTIRGWLFPSESGSCAIVYHHGFTGTRYGGMRYAPLFEYDCDHVFFDARRHGESEGGYGTFGYHEKYDLISIIDWIKEKRQIKDLNIGLFGESFGAATTLMAAGTSEREFAFILVDSPYRDLETIVSFRGEADYGPIIHAFIPLAFLIAEWRADFDAASTSVTMHADKVSTPVMIIHSRQDVYTDPTNSQSVYDSLSGLSEKERILYYSDWEATHARSVDTNREEYTKQVKAFLAGIDAENRIRGVDTTPEP